MTTVSFYYSVGGARFFCEAEFEKWNEMDESERTDALEDAAKEDVVDYLEVDFDTIDDDDE